jgi:hypothetical protein
MISTEDYYRLPLPLIDNSINFDANERVGAHPFDPLSDSPEAIDKTVVVHE